MYIVEFTRGRNNKELVERVRMDLETTGEVIARASAMIRNGDVAADGFRLLDKNGEFIAAARILGTG
jgi:hypothetical protein